MGSRGGGGGRVGKTELGQVEFAGHQWWLAGSTNSQYGLWDKKACNSHPYFLRITFYSLFNFLSQLVTVPPVACSFTFYTVKPRLARFPKTDFGTGACAMPVQPHAA